MARYISFAVLIAIIIVIGALFYKVMIGFFVPVFLAAVLVVVFRPLHRWILSRTGQREHIAAGLTTLSIVLIVLLPMVAAVGLATLQGAKLLSNFNSTSLKLSLLKLRSNQYFDLEFPYAPIVREIQAKIEDIQTQVSKEQSFAEMMSPNGRVQGDIEEVRKEVSKLIPRLFQFHLNEAVVRIEKQESKPLEKSLLEEVETYFQAIEKELIAFLESHDRSSKQETVAAIEEFLQDSTSVPAQSKLNPWTELLEAAKTSAIREAASWWYSFQELNKRIDAIAYDSSLSVQNVVQVQRAVLELVTQWQIARDEISGGPWIGAFKEFANPSDADIENFYRTSFNYLRPKLVSFTSDSAFFLFRLVISSIILLLSLYFFLYDGPRMIRTLMELSPLDDQYELELLAEFDRISRAIVLATILSALVQGITAGIGYYFAGVPSLILMIALTSTAALVPFIGPAIVWVPVCVYLAVFRENWIAAGLLAAWGVLIVGTVDNLVKVAVLHGQSQLHPLLGLLSVLGGIQTLGPIGILVGPMVVVMLQTLLGILRKELSIFRSEDLEVEGHMLRTEEPNSQSEIHSPNREAENTSSMEKTSPSKNAVAQPSHESPDLEPR